ncbi:glycosyltransferase family 4 protein [Isoptericola aurantiacus]|uniref:glycosyltransferase family 4 protein n=1 Tax=Isoptericola aurantiacus TaxID=3377839 RepID=UPI00383B5D69
MRILHAVVSDAFAGVERHVARLARAQSAAGLDVHVAGGATDAMVRELDGSRATHASAGSISELVRDLRQHRDLADVVHVHMTAAEIAATLALAGRPRGRPAVVSTRHFALTRGHGVTGPVVAAVARHRVDAQIAISRYVAAGIDGSSAVVPAGLDAAPPGPAARERGRTVLLAQRLQPEKRSDVAIRAFAQSGLAAEGWTLDVAGDGAERERLERLASSLGILPGTSVRFLGHRADVAELMRSAGMLVAPCPVEGLGLSVLEAMAAGLPVVASAAGGHLELLDGVGRACLAPAGEADATGDALAVLGADPGLRDAVAARALTRQRQRFTLAAQASATTDVYRRVLRAARTPRTRSRPAVRA